MKHELQTEPANGLELELPGLVAYSMLQPAAAVSFLEREIYL